MKRYLQKFTKNGGEHKSIGDISLKRLLTQENVRLTSPRRRSSRTKYSTTQEGFLTPKRFEIFTSQSLNLLRKSCLLIIP